MSSNPVRVSKILSLRELGFNEKCFKFGLLTLEGDRFVCIKEVDTTIPSVAIIDLYHENALSRKPMKAEAAIMNPAEPIIALKAPVENGHFMQVFHLETKEKLGTHQFSDKISFWRWISKEELVVVTDKTVFHWLVGRCSPVPMFERAGKLAEGSTKLVGYACDKDRKWCILYGIYSTDQGSTVEGALQLFSTERKQQQLLEGYAGTFTRLKTTANEAGDLTGLFIFCEHKRGAPTSKLHVMDIYSQNVEGQKPPLKVSKDMIPSAGDFPIAVYALDSCGLICILTKNGCVHFHDVLTASFLFTENVTDSAFFVSCAKRNPLGNIVGILGVTRNGDLISVTVDETRLLSSLQRSDVAVGLASTFGLPGSEKLLKNSFEDLFLKQDYKQAALVVATLKSKELRTPETMERFKNAPAVPGQPSPAHFYFSALLEHGILTEAESLELVKPVVAQGRKELVKKWLDDNKLTVSEKLGELVKPIDSVLAFMIFTKLASFTKAMQCLLDANQFSRIVPFMKKVAETTSITVNVSICGDKVTVIPGMPNPSVIIEQVLQKKPSEAMALLQELMAGLGPNEPLCDIAQVIEIFIKFDKIKEATTILMEYLKPNLARHSHLQTRLLEINLQKDKDAAETLLQMNTLTHFDKLLVARLCEENAMYELALQFYSNSNDLKRVVVKSSGKINVSVMEKVLKEMTQVNALEALNSMIDHGTPAGVVVKCALALQNRIDLLKLAEVFNSRNLTESLYQFLHALPLISSKTPSNEIPHLKLTYMYIDCCIKLNELESLEAICRESNSLELERAKDLLKKTNLPDPKSLMIICHRLGTVQELTEFLYQNKKEEYLEVYVNTINPPGVAIVVSTLFDLGAPESIIFNILNNLRDSGGMRAMIKIADERHQLMILKGWLETRISEGYKEAEIHTAYAKILVATQNKQSEEFLKSNEYYDRATLGHFCEMRDAQLAFLIYSQGHCDYDVARMCKMNSMYKQLAQYALQRSSSKFWNDLFAVTTSPRGKADRQRLCDELIALVPECQDASQVSCALKALMDAEMNEELIGLLEQLLLNDTQFSTNANLQNLLLATTVKTNPDMLDHYLRRLNNYDVAALTKLTESLGLSQCSFSLLKSSGCHMDALDALLSTHNGAPAVAEALKEAKSYVEDVNEPELWFRLGRAYLDAKKPRDAVDCYIKSKDTSDHERIKEACASDWKLFVHWLKEGRKVSPCREMDNEALVYLAKYNETKEFQNIVQGDHLADLNLVGDALIEQGNYKECIQLYGNNPNYAKLAVCYIHLQDYRQASDAALKSRNPQVLKQVVKVCLERKQMKMAEKVALDLLTYQDFLMGLTSLYEKHGYFDELIALLQKAEPTVAVCTELATCIAKHDPDQLMDYLKNTGVDSLNCVRVAKECSNQFLFKEAIYMYSKDSPDEALSTMISHYSVYNEELMLDLSRTAKEKDTLHKALQFCIKVKPLLIPKFLEACRSRIDMSKAIKLLTSEQCLTMARAALERCFVEDCNNIIINNALFDCYLELELPDELDKCILKTDAFDQFKLATRCERHRLNEIRCIAGKIFKKGQNFARAASLHYRDGKYAEAIDAIHSSKSREMLKELLTDFINGYQYEEFLACIVINNSCVDVAQVLEMVWINDMDLNIIMPFLIQTIKNMSGTYTSAPLAIGH